jgi:hypothetical protein
MNEVNGSLIMVIHGPKLLLDHMHYAQVLEVGNFLKYWKTRIKQYALLDTGNNQTQSSCKSVSVVPLSVCLCV